jgi:hypothetical protein
MPTVVDGGTIKVDGIIIRGRVLTVQQVVLLSRDERNARYLSTV